MPGFAWAALALGALVGSFLNVVIARVPRGLSIVSPPSACPRCGARIRPWDNIPVVSWLLLRGRCRDCRAPISGRYPVVEALTALLFAAIAVQGGPRASTAASFVFAALLVGLAWIDLDTWLLPHALTWPLLALGLLSPLWTPGMPWSAPLAGGVLGGGILAAIALFGERVLHKEIMGWGDVWLLAGIGAWEGVRSVLPVLLLASLQGAIVGLALLAAGRRAGNRSSRVPAEPPLEAPVPSSEDDWVPPPSAVPFGPFLALAALEQLLLGELFAWWLWRALGLR